MVADVLTALALALAPYNEPTDDAFLGWPPAVSPSIPGEPFDVVGLPTFGELAWIEEQTRDVHRLAAANLGSRLPVREEEICLFTICGPVSRPGAMREKLLRSSGGNDVTEAAVARSLMWLAKQQ